MKLRGFTFLIMLVFLFFWLNTSCLADRLSSENVSLRYKKTQADEKAVGGLSKLNLEELDKDDKGLPKIMLWNQSDGVSVTTKSNFSANTTVIDIYGANLMEHEILNGAPLSINDKSGCVVDDQTAYTLFGTADAVGKTIYIENIPYVIRGILKQSIPLIMRNAADEAVPFFNAELLFPYTQNGGEAANSFLSSHNLPRPEVIVDQTLIALLAKLIAYLPVAVLIFAMLAKMLLRVFKVRNQTLLFLGCLLFMSASVVALVIVLRLPTTIPLRFIPSRWSDFSFWSSQLNLITANVKEMLAFPKTFMESSLIQDAVALSLSFSAALFALVLLIERIKIQKASELFMFSFAGVAAVFAFCLMQENGFGLNIQAVYLALPCCFLLDLCLNSFDKWLKIPQKEEIIECV